MLLKLSVKIINFFNKRYWLFLILLVLISYGQILGMQPWEDDNAMFFKLAHVEEPAGFIGRGPLGEGVYKYGVTPFIIIYKLFGYFVPAYFALTLIFYGIATLAVYKCFSVVLGKNAGRIAGLFYGAGYIVSDGFIRLANSVTTNISVIIASVFLAFYWKFYTKRRFIWYFLAFLTFWAGSEFSLSRMHYFIAVPILFELIFFAFEKPIKSVIFSFFRILPFLILFKDRVLGTDPRSAGAANLALDIFKGKFDSYYGLMSSFVNLIIPDWMTPSIFFGGILIFLIFYLGRKSENKKMLLFFLLWLLANLYAYASYMPNVVFGTVDRYLAHSFLALCGIWGILSVKKPFYYLVILLVVGNLVTGVIYQNKILKNRSLPVKFFYQDLKVLMPTLNKGDILYFDVSGNRQYAFRDAITAAMMPNSTSFAWRYGIDRYDFSLISDFDELSKMIINENVKPEGIHSFWYSKNGLVETTAGVRNYFAGVIKIPQSLKANLRSDNWFNPEITFNLTKSIKSSVPATVELGIKAEPSIEEDIVFPLSLGKRVPAPDSIWRNDIKRNLTMEYQRKMKFFLKNSKFEVNSVWQDKISNNLYDENPDTFWQSDRVLWQERKDWIKVVLVNTQTIDRISWMNASYKGSIPKAFNIEISENGTNWKVVKEVFNKKIELGQNFQIVSFEPTPAKFVRVNFTDTFGGDSPMVAELRIIPSSLSNLDIGEADNFLEDPFLYVESEADFWERINSFGGLAKARVYWFGNKEDVWLTSKAGETAIFFDSKIHTYTITLPAQGTSIDKIKIGDIKIPGKITLFNVKFY